MLVYQEVHGREALTENDCQIHLQRHETVDQYLWRNFFWPIIPQGKKVSAVYLGYDAFDRLKQHLYDITKWHDCRALTETGTLWGAAIYPVKVSPNHIHAILESL